MRVTQAHGVPHGKAIPLLAWMQLLRGYFGVAETDPPEETEPDARVASELGDVLFAAVNVARRLNVDPELELRAAAKRFRVRVERAAELATADGKDWTALALDEQDAYYDEAKGKEHQ